MQAGRQTDRQKYGTKGDRQNLSTANALLKAPERLPERSCKYPEQTRLILLF